MGLKSEGNRELLKAAVPVMATNDCTKVNQPSETILLKCPVLQGVYTCPITGSCSNVWIFKVTD